MTDLVLQHGLSFADLYDREGLVRLDRVFVAHLAETDVALHDRLRRRAATPVRSSINPRSDLVVDGRFSSITRRWPWDTQATDLGGVPKVRALFEATYFAGLCEAGMLEG
jgi:hypothetical protein